MSCQPIHASYFILLEYGGFGVLEFCILFHYSFTPILQQSNAIFSPYIHFAAPEAVAVNRKSYRNGGLAYSQIKQELFELLENKFGEKRDLVLKLIRDDKQKRWVVDLRKNGHTLKTYLEDGDAEKCLEGIQCVSRGIEIAQLRGNIERM